MPCLEPIPDTLIAQAKADGAVMNECCERLQGVVHSWSSGRCRRDRGADYEETFSLGMVATMQALSSYDGSGKFIVYLSICVRRLWRDELDYRRGLCRRTNLLRDRGAQVDEIIDIRERLARECTAAQVREILDKMPKELANAIRMVYGIGVDRMSVKEAAESCGIDRRNMGRRLREARELFGRLWEPPTEGG